MSTENNKYTQEERDRVAVFWNQQKSEGKVPSLSEIVSFFTLGQESDPRTVAGRRCRSILSDLQIKAKGATWDKVEEVVLTDDHKKFILNHIKDNRVIDLARDLFPDRKVAPLGREVRTINKFLDSVGERVVRKNEETPVDEKYEPPTTFHDILKRVNNYLHTSLTSQSVTAYNKKCLEMTINFLHSPRFLQEINNYASIEKRVAFESEFIRGVFDKPDLQSDEVNLYINLCNDYIQSSDIKKQLEKLNGILDGITDDPDGKISMGITEAIGKVTSSYNECVNRHQKLYSLLNTTRSKRILDKNSATANIVNIIEFFREEDGRQRFLRQAELLKDTRISEVRKIEKLDDVLLLALGMTMEEATI